MADQHDNDALIDTLIDVMSRLEKIENDARECREALESVSITLFRK
jgi:hypothetical protein